MAREYIARGILLQPTVQESPAELREDSTLELREDGTTELLQ